MKDLLRKFSANTMDVSTFNGELFGSWLSRKRRAKGLNISEVAHRAGVSRQYISLLERGQVQTLTGRPSQPSLDKVERIAKAIEADIDEARIIAGYEPLNEDESAALRFEGMFMGFEKLSPEQRRLAVRQIQAIINSILEEEEHDFDYISDEKEV